MFDCYPLNKNKQGPLHIRKVKDMGIEKPRRRRSKAKTRKLSPIQKWQREYRPGNLQEALETSPYYREPGTERLMYKGTQEQPKKKHLGKLSRRDLPRVERVPISYEKEYGIPQLKEETKKEVLIYENEPPVVIRSGKLKKIKKIKEEYLTPEDLPAEDLVEDVGISEDIQERDEKEKSAQELLDES